jgi:hypothetical protein
MEEEVKPSVETNSTAKPVLVQTEVLADVSEKPESLVEQKSEEPPGFEVVGTYLLNELGLPHSTPSLELSEEERREIVESDTFADFFDYSTKVVERILNESYDVTIDYRTAEEGMRNDESNKELSLKGTFYDEKWCRNRSVTSLSWSNKVTRFEFTDLCICIHFLSSGNFVLRHTQNLLVYHRILMDL